MKKSAAKHSLRIKFDATEFFTKHIGIMGLLVVALFLVIYLMMEKMSKLEQKVINLEVTNSEMTAPEDEMMELVE
jgi:Na+-transporting methylmalonyl-CoA/oxaloacetate decarboxylase gamma subunit